MHKSRNKEFEKANDFKGSIKRLFKELKSLKATIIIALILSIVSAFLSILSPSKLSLLTDEISKGLTINEDSLNKKYLESIKNLNEAYQKILRGE